MIAYHYTLHADQGTLNSAHGAGWLRHLTRVRTQLIGGLLVAIVLPFVIIKYLVVGPDIMFDYRNSLIGCTAAFAFGYVVLRKTSALPGSAAFISVLPAFIMSFATVALVFWAFRLDYSRLQFLLSSMITVVWFYGMMVAILRTQRPVFGVISGGRADGLRRVPAIDTVRLQSVADAKARPNLPIVADFQCGTLSDEWERYLAEESIAGRSVYGARPLVESLEGKVQLDRLSTNEMGQLTLDQLYRPAKRYFDSFFALLALVFLSPLLIVVGIAIRLDSEGPALFRQTRMGFRGKTFTVYKFRSMRVQKADVAGRTADMTMSDDDRITAVGRFIRKTRIDELPQIINVLKGEMSWIGPRPETMRLSEWYEKEIPFYRIRHSVRPGITGWAQVRQGHVTSVDDVREKLQYDLFYVKHISLWFDVLVVIHTIRVVLTGHGAK